MADDSFDVYGDLDDFDNAEQLKQVIVQFAYFHKKINLPDKLYNFYRKILKLKI